MDFNLFGFQLSVICQCNLLLVLKLSLKRRHFFNCLFSKSHILVGNFDTFSDLFKFLQCLKQFLFVSFAMACKLIFGKFDEFGLFLSEGFDLLLDVFNGFPLLVNNFFQLLNFCFELFLVGVNNLTQLSLF